MNVEEAMEALGYTMRSNVMHDLKYGRLRADHTGDIDPESVAKLVRVREESMHLRALFLRDDLSPEEMAELASRPRRKNRR